MRDRYSTSVQRHRFTSTARALARRVKPHVRKRLGSEDIRAGPLCFYAEFSCCIGSRPPAPTLSGSDACLFPIGSEYLRRLRSKIAEQAVSANDRRHACDDSLSVVGARHLSREVSEAPTPSARPYATRQSSPILHHLVGPPLQHLWQTQCTIPTRSTHDDLRKLGRDVIAGKIQMEREKR